MLNVTEIEDAPNQANAEYLKLVQGVISRMASSCAQTKTWAVSIVSAIYIFIRLSNDLPSHTIIIVSLFSCIYVLFFWCSCAKYLRLERCYIKLYESVVADPLKVHFDLNYRPYCGKIGSTLRVAMSWSVLLFFSPLFLFTLCILASSLGIFDF